ncbi:hypothetical protein [Reichenbachiella sp.]|uniref:hypothetical protein n=1 Tax=Reichenbachiella sp. TaxID=2184521 RepID=UPI003BB18114
MKINRLILFFSLLITAIYGECQIPVGYYYDLDNEPIEGYFDVLDYSPENSVNISMSTNEFILGSYFSNGEENFGLLKYQNKKIWFKSDYEEKKIKLDPDDVEWLILGVDSFFTATNFNVEYKVGPTVQTDKQFMKYLCAFGDLEFAVHYSFSSGMGQMYAMQSPMIKTYQVRKKGSHFWESFPRRNKAFIDVALKYFGHIPVLKSKIMEREWDYENMYSLIKMAEYHYKYNNGDTIHFNEYWGEVRNMEVAVYTGKVINIEDSIWTVNYYKGNSKLYSAQYSSFYPMRKNGFFKSFYENGVLRKETIFKNDQKQTVRTFDSLGVNQCVYTYHEVEQGYDIDAYFKYSKTSNSEDQYLSGSRTEIVKDQISNRRITNTYKEGIKIESFSGSESDKVYQSVDLNNLTKFKGFNSMLKDHLSNKEFYDVIKADAEGYLLVHCIVDEKGFVETYKLLNTLHPLFDNMVKDFLSIYCGPDRTYSYKLFKPLKVGKEKVKFEVVVPVQVVINDFYRESNYYYNDMFMHQQMMMQQQMMAPPPAPSFY